MPDHAPFRRAMAQVFERWAQEREPAPIQLEALIVPAGATVVLRSTSDLLPAERARMHTTTKEWAQRQGVNVLFLDGAWQAVVIDEPAKKGVADRCPCCGSADVAQVSWLEESFERRHCVACGATGRASPEPGLSFEEVPLPVSAQRSAPPKSSDSLGEGSAP